MTILCCLAIGLLFCLVQPNSGYYQGNGDIQNEYVRTGSNATLVCQPASDVDNVNRLIWYKEDKKIAEVVNGRRTFWDAGPHVNLQPHNNALYFRRVTYPDSGEYSCEVNGKRTRNSIARLLVQDAAVEDLHFVKPNLYWNEDIYMLVKEHINLNFTEIFFLSVLGCTLVIKLRSGPYHTFQLT
ncbi:ig-like domain-containing protein [Nephila pilipes]|uniref:Ig-like domain-containing protein n=1 Tax=Nephila pilipes TaxID=299642 RepID=A0A8X6QI35_NEPPI|nr:ig-like domain-containing protein [Nephila pilipes]